MPDITRAQFHEICRVSLKIINEEGLLTEAEVVNDNLQRHFMEFLSYNRTNVLQTWPASPAPSPMPTQKVIDTITLKCAIILTSHGVYGLHFNESLNMLRSYIVDILIKEYGNDLIDLKYFGVRWGCYRLWVTLAIACDASHIEETRQFWREHSPDHFEEDQALTPQT